MAGFAMLFRPRKKVMGLLTRIKGEDTHLATKLTKQKSLSSSPILIPYLDISPTIPEQTILIVSTPDFTLTKLYSLYKEYCAEKGEHPVSDWVYCKVFNENYNLRFGR